MDLLAFIMALKAQGMTAAQITEAVNQYLQDHPDALDQAAVEAILDGRLDVIDDELSSVKSAIDDKAPAIKAPQTGYSHENVDSFVMNGNQYAFGNARYANKKNLIVGKDTSRLEQGVTIQSHGNIIVLNGESTGGSNDIGFWNLEVDIPAGTYIFKIEPYVGESILNYGKNIHLFLWYDGNTSSTRDVTATAESVKNNPAQAIFTITQHVYKIRVFVGLHRNTYSNYKLFYSLFPSDVAITNTGETIPENESLVVTTQNKMPIVDTMMHTSTVESIIDTKEYVDSKVPEGMLTKEDIVYLSPEMFGAKGDGINDDSSYIADCLAASRINDETYIPVRGFGRYRVSNPIAITGMYANVYLHCVIYTGADTAVKINGSNCIFKFDYIIATSSVSAVGLKIDATGSVGFNSNNTTCGCIRSSSHAVLFESISGRIISYSVFHFGLLRTSYGDAFHFNVQSQCNETDIYGKYVYAQNGHFAIAENNSSIPDIRFHQFCLESDLKYGIKRVGAKLIECRTDEFMGLMGDISDPKKGILFDFDNTTSMGCYADHLTPVNIDSIDVSGASSYEDAIELVTELWNALPPDASSNDKHYILFRLMYRPSVFKRLNAIKLGTMQAIPNGEIVVIFDKKMVRLNGEFYYKPTSSEFRPIDIFPTFIDIIDVNASTASIYLNDSYSWPGINKFVVKQYNEIKAKVYDKNGNLIFDGSNEDAGIYEFECSFIRLSELNIDLTGGGTYSVPSAYLNTIYTGNNEKWHIYKKAEVT